MRELKFRIYDNKSKSHYTSETRFQYKGDVDEIYSTDLSFFFVGLDGIKSDNNLIIEQFTGLYDINGKEIYDGDIIKFHPSIMTFIGDGCIWENCGYVNIPDLTTGVLIHYNHPYSEICDSLADILKQYYGIERTEPLKYELVGTTHD